MNKLDNHIRRFLKSILLSFLVITFIFSGCSGAEKTTDPGQATNDSASQKSTSRSFTTERGFTQASGT